MLTAVGFITIVTAAITSTFVEAARRRSVERGDADETRLARVEAALTSIDPRLREIERELRGGHGGMPPS